MNKLSPAGACLVAYLILFLLTVALWPWVALWLAIGASALFILAIEDWRGVRAFWRGMVEFRSAWTTHQGPAGPYEAGCKLMHWITFRRFEQ